MRLRKLFLKTLNLLSKRLMLSGFWLVRRVSAAKEEDDSEVQMARGQEGWLYKTTKTKLK